MSGQKAGKRTIKNLIKEFKADSVKNANVIADVMERLQSNESGTIVSAITGLHHIFTFLLHEEAITHAKAQDSELSASDQLNAWLKGKLEETHRRFLQLLTHKERTVQEMSLCSIVKLIQSEGRHPIKVPANTNYYFPLPRLQALMGELVSDQVNQLHLITLLLEYLEYQDFMFFTLLSLKGIVKAHKGKEITETYMNNLFPLLEAIKVPEEGTKSLIAPRLLLDPNDNTAEEASEQPSSFTLSYPKARKAMNTVWQEVICYSLTPDLYRRCLVFVPENVMPHLDKPLTLTGFFMESYNLGGAISLLALQGVFILMHKHNLDYPDFYKKLYALLEPTVFHAKYRPRFFMLLDRFLSSSHLPEYLVAAFTKRLARLSLVAPSCCLVLIIKFVTNLLIRFPSLRKLTNNPAAQALERDPYLADEPDPVLSHAGESSLWELAALQHHAIPYVSKVAGFLHKNLPSREYDIGDFVESSYEEIFERARKLTVRQTIPTTFHPPKGLFSHHDDQMSESWSLT